MIYFRMICGALGTSSIGGAALNINLAGQGGGTTAALTALPQYLPALVLGFLYFVEAVIPEKYWDQEGRIGAEAVHITTSVLALLCIWLKLESTGAPQLSVALYQASSSISIYTAVLVMSGFKLVKHYRGANSLERRLGKASASLSGQHPGPCRHRRTVRRRWRP